MNQNRRSGVRWFALGVVIACVLAVAPLQFGAQTGGDAPAAVSSPKALATLGFKFNGSPGCASEKCHGSEKATERPDLWGNEYTLWHGRRDPHHTAYRTLISPKSKEIATKLKIAAANKSERCLECHSTYAVGPSGQDLQGKEYTAAEGVSCDSCHGPSQKWFDPHAQQGWIKQQRASLSHDDLVKTWGLYDTQPVLKRAERCTGCHLSTEADLVAAGHPQPVFEMYHFSAIYPERHWRDAGGTFAAEVWASGQVVELREVLIRLAREAAAKPAVGAEELKRSFERAMAHYDVFTTVLTNGSISEPGVAALDADIKNLTAAMGGPDPAAVAAAATAAAGDAQKLASAIEKFKPDKALSQKILSAIVSVDLANQFGVEGQEQQAYAIEAMAQASGADAVAAAVPEILPKKPGEALKPDAFSKGLDGIRAKLAK